VCCSGWSVQLLWRIRLVDYEECHCNTLQYAATPCNTLQYTATPCNTLRHTIPHCNTLHHTATHDTTLQHTAWWVTATHRLVGLLGMGWLRLVGSLKSQVSFAKEPFKETIFCKKEICNLKKPTNRSHPISTIQRVAVV